MFKQLLNLFRRWYIIHEDVQTPENGIAYFGPFRGWEMNKRINDAYADLLAQSGNLETVGLSRKDRKSSYINPRKYWMDQEKNSK